ncbi:MAG: response regulator transcription factor, partial [Pseudolysinimonas sp.]
SDSDSGDGSIGPEPPIRLLIADDQPLIRRGLAMMLASESGIEVVGQAADGVAAVQLALATRPDVVVMDLQMPKKSGVVATQEIRAALPQTRVVVLTTYDDDELVYDALRAGAQAYLLKDASEADVLETIRAVRRGESRLSPSIARKVVDQFRAIASRPPRLDGPSMSATTLETSRTRLDDTGPPPAAAASGQAPQDALTEKEQHILELISQGQSNRQIAAAVFLAEGTVKNYVSRIMEKLHAHSRTELAVRAVTGR